eukprot:474546-Alexandrium_andersonii.AAC.1
MSASLVGSEMCIRDSRRGPSQPSRGRLPSGAVLWAKMLSHNNLGCCEDCLLYTSDAADDM